MTKKTFNTSVRLTSRHSAFLRARALTNGRSFNAELGEIIREAAERCPIKFVFRDHTNNPESKSYSVSIGETDPFFQGRTARSAYAAQDAKIEELGLSRLDVVSSLHFSSFYPDEGEAA